VLWQDAGVVLAREIPMLGDALPTMRDHQPAAAAGHLDRLVDEREGHRATVGLEAHETVVGPGLPCHVALGLWQSTAS
jgi:hypothetical protein